MDNTVNLGGRAHWEIRLQGRAPSPLGSVFWSREVLVPDCELDDAIERARAHYEGWIDDLVMIRATRHDFDILPWRPTG